MAMLGMMLNDEGAGMNEPEKREKVIKGLECCKIPFTKCYSGGCPYFENDGCKARLKGDALALLKAQKPKVMTLEEIADLKYHDMVYVEFRHPTKEKYRAMGGFVDQMYKDTDTGEIKAIDITFGVNEIAHCSMKLYLNDFRLWTSIPTAEQMNAVPWV